MADQKTHWRKIIESEYLAGADLDDGKGNHPAITVTIREARQENVMDPGTKKEESCLILHFREQIKPMICNATNAKAITKALGSGYIQDWEGKRIIVGTESIKAFGEIWDALRVKPFAPKPAAERESSAVCADCKQPIPDHEGVPARQIAASTHKKYGRPLCYECVQKSKIATEAPANAAE